MKKVFMGLCIFLSSIIYADFLDAIQKIDTHIQKEEYKKALKESKKLLKTKITPDEKYIVENIIEEIKEKIPKDDDIFTVQIDSLLKLDIDSRKNSPIIYQAEKDKFEEYKEFETKIVQLNDSKAIYNFALLYISEGLYESAMKVALKDPFQTEENLYLAATSARMIGKYDKSINLYEKVLKNNEAHIKSYLGLAMVYKLKGDFEKAVIYLERYNIYKNSPEIEEQIKRLKTLEGM